MIHTDTLHRRIQDARRRFERAGIEPAEAAIDADVLARHALGGWERGELLVRQHDACPAGFSGIFEALVGRREAREPAGYIIGHREFWNLDMEVGPGVLVPRPETEFLVEETLARLSPADTGPGAVAGPAGAAPPARARVADVGTGSGCISVALARWLPASVIVATDNSDEALAVARRNAARHEVTGRVRFVKTDLLAGVAGPFDAVVSNPPYVPAADIAGLQPEVRDHEPLQALAGGDDGLDVVRRLVPAAAAVLTPGGWLVFEFGFGQAESVRGIIAAEPQLELVEIKADLAGIPRVAVAQRRSDLEVLR
ncbi:MAG: peptide chain release factor N(5)-glutamine methyltransferase [Vicinamibacterales bacterium]